MLYTLQLVVASGKNNIPSVRPSSPLHLSSFLRFFSPGRTLQFALPGKAIYRVNDGPMKSEEEGRERGAGEGLNFVSDPFNETAV